MLSASRRGNFLPREFLEVNTFKWALTQTAEFSHSPLSSLIPIPTLLINPGRLLSHITLVLKNLQQVPTDTSRPKESDGHWGSELVPACLCTQLFHTWVHQLWPMETHAVHSRLPGISCLYTCLCHPSCQPGATKYGCSVHELCRCMWQPSICIEILPILGIYKWFWKVFSAFPQWTCIMYIKIERKKSPMRKESVLLFRIA